MDKSEISRRSLISGVGMFAAGAALSAGAMGFLTDAEAKTQAAPTWPWPYVKLDPDKTAEIAYNEWYRLYCGGAVISSIFGQLKEKVGQPYASFPTDAFIFLEGGISGWGTVCGSNAGANVVANVIIGPKLFGDGMLMGSEMMQWYSDAAMPVLPPERAEGKVRDNKDH